MELLMKLTNDKQLWMPDAEMWHRWGSSYEKDKFKKMYGICRGETKACSIRYWCSYWYMDKKVIKIYMIGLFVLNHVMTILSVIREIL